MAIQRPPSDDTSLRSFLYRPISSDSPKLRVGVLLDSLIGEEWIGRILTDIAASAFAGIVLIMLNEHTPREPVATKPVSGLLSRFNSGLFRAYRKLDARKSGPGSCFALTDLGPSLGNTEILRVEPICTGSAHCFSPRDVAAVGAGNLDVLLCFSHHTVKGDILHVSRFGTWALRHCGDRAQRGDPAMLWESHDASPLTSTILEVLTEDSNSPAVLYRSIGTTHLSFWLATVHESLYHKAIPFVTRCLRRLYLSYSNWITMEGLSRPAEKKAPGEPTNAQMARFFIASAGRSVRGSLINSITREQWFLAYRHDPKKFIHNTSSIDPMGFTVIVPPVTEFWADPFVFVWNGEDYVFFESYSFRQKRGRICVFNFDEQQRPRPPTVALEAGFHISNPFVFEWQGKTYMIPETAGTLSLSLFRAVSFPTHWVHDRDLMTGLPMVDATLHLHNDGLWYLFLNVSEAGGSLDDELFLFYADTPMGPWRPHSQNPIRSDVRCARPAGRLFHRQGALIRPSQDCSITYGHALNLCAVDTLSPERYSERIIDRLEATWLPGLLGCHTLTASDRVELVDGRKRVIRRPATAIISLIRPDRKIHWIR